MTVGVMPFSECRTAREALFSLGAKLRGEDRLPSELPAGARGLLVHHEHMTETLRERYGGAVTLRVLEEKREGDVYWRKIVLNVGERLVECGIVRILLQYMPREAADQILERRTPLGEVLIQQNIFRWIEPKWYIEVGAGGLKEDFGEDGFAGVSHGRIGVIYCNKEPAIELLEVVCE